ncbi:PilZ domain-containing protein [Novosphingobium sp. FKTRR1]|uniref:PilZ domain-containing protein n=1 Tax=unclassified Novosphingobium TaxID=2644732 RepID=UPI001CF0B62A|nr:PilZ domain-containing protein [Novosphingobium sp. FKTRR1]
MTAPYEAFKPEEVRRSVRGELVARILYRRTVQRVDATTLDLSCHGLRLRAKEALEVGEILWVTLPGLPPRRVKVVWVKSTNLGTEAGCNFFEPLHPAISDAIVDGRLG